MRERLIALIELETGSANVSLSTRLDDLGIDSLSFVSLMQAISSEIKDVPKSSWVRIDRVGDILAVLEA